MITRGPNQSKFWFVIRLHLVLLWGLFTSGSATTACSSSGGGCPVKATTHFIRRNMAFVGRTFAESSPSAVTPPPLPSKHSKQHEPAYFRTSNHYINPIESKQFLSRLYMTNADNPPGESGRRKKKGGTSAISGRDGIVLDPGKPPDGVQMAPAHDVDLVVVGLSHHTAPVEVREKLSISEDGWNPAAKDLCSMASIDEAVVLSTCNRFELYLTGRNEYEAIKDALEYLHKRTNGTLDQDTLRKSIFMLSGDDAMWHLMRVSSGITAPFCRINYHHRCKLWNSKLSSPLLNAYTIRVARLLILCLL